MVNAFRYGFLGISDVPMSLAFGVMGGLTLVAFVVTLILFRNGAGLKN
jgi:ABC-2 type transport system permease protein